MFQHILGLQDERQTQHLGFRRKGAPQFWLDDLDRKSKEEQWENLQQFFGHFNNPDGSAARGITDYETPDQFRREFEHHLCDRLDLILESMPVGSTLHAASPAVTAPF